ncbi:YihY/virulence factor BrkB family protein [Cobetia sp. cqz5-12]|uniref:YihY/virulence factor BrkB family protein n=1 Tax=Cobetia sp. cqz5-12 TaxID=2609415 RepID=UPI001906BB1B|nr:YihY/virulence factor BrkB family protein [Cobetia sp. cqz5-12]QQK63785.1 YihY/virulence factor BrkB family protein [Cobetia sp. cqz5-12]
MAETPDDTWRARLLRFLPRLIGFAWRVLGQFIANRGVLLAGGVGYNILLSSVPLFALSCVLLTHLVDESRLMSIIAIQVQHLGPGQEDVLLDAVRKLLDNRDVISWIGMGGLLFFAGLAFRMLEDAIALIFHQHPVIRKRSAWISALLPYAFVMVLGAGLLALTLLVALASAMNDALTLLTGIELTLGDAGSEVIYLISIIGMFGLFSAIYKILPQTRVSTRRALVGGLVAATLWELTRLALSWYFTHLSFVGAIYGSLATLIVLLLGLEIGAIILLLGAQVIAELEQCSRENIRWYRTPDRKPLTRLQSRRNAMQHAGEISEEDEWEMSPDRRSGRRSESETGSDPQNGSDKR